MSINDDKDAFRLKCQEARRYVDEIIKGRLCAARDELGLMGLWAGHGVAVGLTIDFDETSPTYRQYFPYQPHAEIVEQIFKRYRQLDGAFTKLGRELEIKQPVFPPFEGLERIPNIQLAPAPNGGYLLEKDGLRSILTNAMYIGTHTYQGHKREGNHPAIVDPDDFWYAFNRLSPTDLDGNPIVRESTRPKQYQGVKVAPVDALLSDKARSNPGEVYVISRQKAYAISRLVGKFSNYETTFSIDYLDSAVAEQVRSQLQLWKRTEEIVEQVYDPAFVELVKQGQTPYILLKAIMAEEDQALSSVVDMIPATEARIKVLLRNLDLDVDDETAAGWARELKDKKTELARLKAKKEEAEKAKDTAKDLQNLLETAGEMWDSLPFERQKRLFNRLIEEVIITESAPHFLTVELVWSFLLSHIQIGHLYRRYGNSDVWKDEENEILRELYPGAPRMDILRRLPDRSWVGIKNRATDALKLKRPYQRNPETVPVNLALRDIQFMWNNRLDPIPQMGREYLLPDEKRYHMYWEPLKPKKRSKLLSEGVMHT